MIIVFNWKDKTPDSYQNVFLYYRKIAEKVLLIVCPNETFIEEKVDNYDSSKINYCIQKPDFKILQADFSCKFDYVMINHQRFKELLDINKIKKISEFNKKPIICFSSINEINNIKGIKAIWAYEPEKNIGSSTDLNLDEILVELNNIKKQNIAGKLLYGGGVRADNFLEIYHKIGHLVDGFLIGDKSVDPNFLKTFAKLIPNIGKHN